MADRRPRPLLQGTLDMLILPTAAGRKQLTAEMGKWERMVRAITRVLRHPQHEEM
jgi:hypothetical protein